MFTAALLCLVLVGIFAGSETVLVSANRIRVRRRAERADRRGRAMRSVLAEPRAALSTALAGTAVCTVLTSALVTVAVDHRWGPEAAGLAALAQTVAILIFGEVVPKSLGRARADALFPSVSLLLRWAGFALWPVLKLATWMSTAVLAVLGARPEGRRGFLARADVEVLLREAAARGAAERAGTPDLERVLDLRTTTLDEVMVPHTDLVSVEADTPAAEALALAAASGHSRLVVYEGTVDAAVGLVHIFDLLRSPGRRAGEVARKVPVLPESVSSLDAFRRLADAQETVALVTDEYGGIAGLVSLSDLVQELTDEVPESVRRADAPVKHLGEHRWLASGRTPVDTIPGIPGLVIPSGAYETLAGYMLARLGAIPKPGARVQLGPWSLTVQDADQRRILSILVERGAAGA